MPALPGQIWAAACPSTNFAVTLDPSFLPLYTRDSPGLSVFSATIVPVLFTATFACDAVQTVPVQTVQSGTASVTMA
jgi:hypothetical protein